MRLVSYKIISASLADDCKSHYLKLISVTKECKPDFLNFDKSEQRLDEFLWNYVGNAPLFYIFHNKFRMVMPIL